MQRRMLLTLDYEGDDDIGDCLREAERIAAQLSVDVKFNHYSPDHDTETYLVRYDAIEPEP